MLHLMFPIQSGLAHFDSQLSRWNFKLTSIWSLDADKDSPVPGAVWLEMGAERRLRLVDEAVKDWLAAGRGSASVKGISVTSTTEQGSVFLSIDGALEVQHRSGFLLDLESFLKQVVDESLVIWCEPNQDRNALRRLRGVRVNS
jgi:hypothetical protein